VAGGGQQGEQPGNWVIGNQPTADGVEQVILVIGVLRRSTVPLRGSDAPPDLPIVPRSWVWAIPAGHCCARQLLRNSG
jgi:hypothetical protein